MVDMALFGNLRLILAVAVHLGLQLDTGAIVGGVFIVIVIIIIAIVAFVFRRRLLLFYRVCVSRYRKKRHAAANSVVDRVTSNNGEINSAVYINMGTSRPVHERPISMSDTDAFYADVHTMGEASEKRGQNPSKTEKYPSGDPTTGVYINDTELAQNSDTVASGPVNQTVTPQSRQSADYYSYTQPPIPDPIYGNTTHTSQTQQPQENDTLGVYEKLQTGANTSSNYSALTFKNPVD
ncbi:uncharacterized protein LOC135461977 [Liolophura sinensis]|uniref:uncharacterized protein LOC135461977 n=1 Tax=Liolophura sinensis TaxID=3198878 RepID=UPI003158B00F